jgi:CxxC-x17-CxxC domain-containing protein
MPDSQIRCSDCGELFLFSEQEQAFFAEKGLNTAPKRCKPCRQARKSTDRGSLRSNDGGQRPSGGGGFGDRSRGAPSGGSFPRGASSTPRGGEGGWRPRNAGPVAAGPQQAHPASTGGPRAGGWKTPHAPQTAQAGAPRARERTFAGASPAHAPPREPPPAAAKPAARERAAKPKFDITCAECGAPSQVPFKPLEGRQVYCQPCYRLRKIASPETVEPRDLDARGADHGIVE